MHNSEEEVCFSGEDCSTGQRERGAEVMSEEKEDLAKVVEQLSRQIMMQQMIVEERIRTDGDSGLKQIRHGRSGTRPYHGPAHAGHALAAMHEHANHERTVGLGEFTAVLNGVEFRTRHNDFKLVMPSTTSNEYHATELVPFPDVPPEVLQLEDIGDQIKEMKEWFKAFKNQDPSIRDYRKYFRPIVCYLEGAWTTSVTDVEESFESDRHQIDAQSWAELQDKIRFTAYSGRKDNNENFAYLPTTVMEVKEGKPVLAQWNYRILCHPLKDDLPLNRFRVIDDLGSRMSHLRTLSEHENSRAARFQINPFDKNRWREGKGIHTLMDDIMEQIPGKDNYGANLTDMAFGLPASHLHRPEGATEDPPINAGYYHRWYKVNKKGAMGLMTRHRGFADENLFMALTTQPKVSPMTLTDCKKNRKETTCEKYTQRWTYAIPLEIIYLTPLSKWNPYKVEYKGEGNSPAGRTVRANGRNGETPEKAYDGVSSNTYCLIPHDFFSEAVIGVDAADTSKKSLWVLGGDSEAHHVVASGQRIFVNIPDVGSVRLRYPIMPLHGHGSAVWKELEALKDIVLSPNRHAHLFHESVKFGSQSSGEKTVRGLTLKMREGPRQKHEHFIDLSAEEVMELHRGGFVYGLTTEAGGHSHNLKLAYTVNDRGLGKFEMIEADGKLHVGHPKILDIVK